MTGTSPESGPLTSFVESQVTLPLTSSLPANETATGALYQLLWSGARPAVAVTVGGVASYARFVDAGATLPAASMQLPVTVAVPESGPAYGTGASQLTPPLSASVPANETETGALYQVSMSGVRDAVAVTSGGVSSYENGNDI